MDEIIKLRDEIETAALELGASRAAVFKWRSRGIPADWRIKLISEPSLNFSLSDFDRVDSIGTRGSEKREAAQ